ncbi:MAG: RDD family protein [Blastochloris sp.]|nr:RDD family protein [Blastochloris sp.]
MSALGANSITLQTPEGIRFRLILAGPLVRMLAWLVDLSVIVAALTTLGTLSTLLGYVSQDLALAMGILSYFVISVGYGIVMEWLWRGQTLGKRLFRLRVVDEQGLALSLHQITMRNLLRVIDLLPGLYLVGGLSLVLSRRCQRLGDYAAATLVTFQPRILAPDFQLIMPDKYNSLRDHPHLCARLIRKISPEQAQIGLQTILRREELDPTARLELCQRLASDFKSMVPFPPETTWGLSDEHYVRNVVDILFQPKS